MTVGGLVGPRPDASFTQGSMLCARNSPLVCLPILNIGSFFLMPFLKRLDIRGEAPTRSREPENQCYYHHPRWLRTSSEHVK